MLLSGKLDLERIAKAVGTPYFLGKPYSAEQLFALSERALTERMPPRPALPSPAAP